MSPEKGKVKVSFGRTCKEALLNQRKFKFKRVDLFKIRQFVSLPSLKHLNRGA